MKKSIFTILSVFTISLTISFSSCRQPAETENIGVNTVCNPMNLNYRFQLEEPSRREAADPTVILYKDTYYLFASKSGGYWYSDDLLKWDFIQSDEIPTEDYAPTAIAIDDTVYFLASSRVKSTIYKSANPMSGHWTIARETLDEPVWDPAFFLDDDNRLYLYWGCSNETPIYGIELDYGNNFTFIGKRKELIFANPSQNGWEVPGDYNTMKCTRPWIEGAWMNKHDGKYYLQYSGPGTEFKSYADGVYISDSPLGPYKIASHNPVAYKPEGFAAGAGHGSTFADKWGNYWHVGTITISVKHLFERRLGFYPTFFDADGTMYTVTKYGDYPIIVPQERITDFKDIFPGWMLLSYDKEVDVSSSIDSLPPSNMTDENIRTYWSARSGDENEWASVDLGGNYDVYAVQINFAEHNTKIFNRQTDLTHQYILRYSNDNSEWNVLTDRSANQTDNTHDYIQLSRRVKCRYLKINNKKVPDGNFAISGFRIFGKGNGSIPDEVKNLLIQRDPENRRTARLEWDPSLSAIGYNISFGTDRNKLYNNYMVYKETSLVLNSLDTNRKYYFTIEAFNENGRTPGEIIVENE
jgi:hypothetical protein